MSLFLRPAARSARRLYPCLYSISDSHFVSPRCVYSLPSMFSIRLSSIFILSRLSHRLYYTHKNYRETKQFVAQHKQWYKIVPVPLKCSH